MLQSGIVSNRRLPSSSSEQPAPLRIGLGVAARAGVSAAWALGLLLGCSQGASPALQPGPQAAPERSTITMSEGEGEGAQDAEASVEQAQPLEHVLVFTRTQGYRHASIEPGIRALRELGQQNGFRVSHTEATEDFNDESLAQYDVLVFLSTSEDALDEAAQEALQRYIQAGGGWVGIHSASDTEYDWPWYGGLIGGDAWFLKHPKGTANASLLVEPSTATHPSTAHFASTFEWQDEWYNFRKHPGEAVKVLLRLDESSYAPGDGAMGDDHPIAWYHEYDGGRSWYTAIGHRSELYADPDYRQHVLGGLLWASGTPASVRP